MKKILLFLLVSTITQLNAQSFQKNEFLKYRVHYGFLNAGFATLKIKETNYEGQTHYHIVGKGSSSGAVRAFYKIDDRYETYINKETLKPSKFIRKINEGGHKKHKILTFDHRQKLVKQNDKLAKEVKYIRFQNEIQDMISAFYFLRTKTKYDFKTGEFLNVNVFMDEEEYPFKLKVLGRETIKTKFGKIKCIKLQPFVQKGRIFEEEESVEMWVSDDENLVPIRLKAKLTIGSLKMDLYDYSHLKSKLFD